jgi:formamidopyrimidine-DNA glycosylase
MPELPEVETTCRGIGPWLKGACVRSVDVRQRRLRWPVPRRLDRELPGRAIHGVDRRAKYLLLRAGTGTLIMHLGMSGSLRILDDPPPPGPHDHVDLELDNDRVLRFCDPRRFGAMLWTTRPPERHRLLKDLGPEPLGETFSGAYLYERSRGRRLAVKNFIMDGRIVVGVGNIYASESLFRSGIHPARAAGRISLVRYEALAAAIRDVLGAAIRAGGTTLRDFSRGDGRPGYFARELRVYERAGQPCPACGLTLQRTVIGQRSTYFCPGCQR